MESERKKDGCINRRGRMRKREMRRGVGTEGGGGRRDPASGLQEVLSSDG